MPQSSPRDEEEAYECFNEHKGLLLTTFGVSFLVGVIMTGLSMGCGFAYYLRSIAKESYHAYELELTEDTFDEIEDHSHAYQPRQKP